MVKLTKFGTFRMVEFCILCITYSLNCLKIAQNMLNKNSKIREEEEEEEEEEGREKKIYISEAGSQEFSM